MATLTRSQLADELAYRAGWHLRNVGLDVTDVPGGIREPLDDTLRALGVDDVNTGTLDSGELATFLAAGKVYILRHALDVASGFADVAATGLGVSKRRNQIVENLRDALYRAESEAAMHGIEGLQGTMAAGVFALDYVEPEVLT